jgi:two-component system, OmpR family, sensor histidine kinase KdpD
LPENDINIRTDDVLTKAKVAETQPKLGHLKIFLGYCAGVGKTYAMLEATREIKSETDVAIGYVETHGRKETEALLQGLEILPRRQLEHRGISIPELDLDSLLSRHPALALVDELAHSNAPGSRHLKRYQDVQELLEAGIDVYTTLNVQHVESLRDVVAQITGVWMRETVPDAVIDSASEIELVDLPPDELLKRLKEGKVYLAEQAALATDQFFRKGNLLALRELAMRIAAERVDEQVRAYKDTHAIREVWPTTERILVCVSSSSSGTKLVRTARRLAAQLDAPWMALYVETPDASRLSCENRQQIGDTLRLAVRLGAKETTTQGNSVADTVVEYARQNGWTKIIVGRPKKRKLWRPPGSSVADQLIHRSENIDIYVVSGTGDAVERHAVPARFSFGKWRGYLAGVVLVVLSTILAQLLNGVFDPTNIIMIYLLSVMAVASIWGLGPSIMTSLLSVLAFDFFLVPPFLTFAVGDTQYIFTFIVLLLVGIALSFLTARVRRQVEAGRQREHEIVTLYSTARTLALTAGIESIVNSIVEKAKEVFGRETMIFLPEPNEQGKLLPRNRGSKLQAEENDIAAATWSFEHKQTAGFGTDTLPDARARFLPLVTSGGIVGVLALWKIDGETRMPNEQERLLEAFADLTAVAIERTKLAEEARSAQVLQATEKLQTALLNSVSHDLRTPLVSIIGTLGSLKEKSLLLSESDREALIGVALEQGERLNHLISNLLDVSRIEAEAVTLSRQPTEVKEVLGVALAQMKNRLDGRQVDIRIPKNLPYISIDSGIVAQVLVNLLDNAVKYSPKGFPIEISARKLDDFIEIQIDDFGIGIPKDDLARVFDKFYRVHRPDNVAGSGLGLSIAKGFIEAHGGTITAQNRQGGGTIVKFSLPTAREVPEASK